MRKSIRLGKDLTSWLVEELTRDEGLTVVHAGHFIIDSSGSWARDHLSSEESLPEGLESFIEFTRITWDIACTAVMATPEPVRPYLFTLVNDWQFISISLPKRRKQESLAAAIREEYYRQTPSFPNFHLGVMAARGIEESRVFKASDERWLFSESDLRHQLARTVRTLLRNGKGAEMALARTFDENGHPKVSVTSSLAGEYCLLFCGSTNCAGEVMQLLKDLHERGVRRCVNLYPYQCMGPVLTGTNLAREMFGLLGMKVINLAVPFLPHSDGLARVAVDVVES